jgi:hypothetical protein
MINESVHNPTTLARCIHKRRWFRPSKPGTVLVTILHLALLRWLYVLPMLFVPVRFPTHRIVSRRWRDLEYFLVFKTGFPS